MKIAMRVLIPIAFAGVSVVHAEGMTNGPGQAMADKATVEENSELLKDEEALLTEEVVSWGTKVKSSSVHMGSEDFDIRQADHLSDLLRTIPGIDVGGAHSVNQRITIRSMDDKDLRISIDGANQNTYMYHHMGNLQIHADILQSVDVEVGTNSVIDGGLGGVVRFETKSAEQLLKENQNFGARAQIGEANNGGSSWSLSAFGKLSPNVDFLAYHNNVDRENFEVGGGELKDQDGVLIPGTDGKVRGFEGEVEDTLLKLGWEADDSQRFEIGYERYSDIGDYSYRPDMGLATDLAIADSLEAPLLWPTEFTRDTITLNYDTQLGNTLVKFVLYDNQSELARDESGFRESTVLVRGQPVADWAAFIMGQADNRGFNVLAETNLRSQTLTYGAEITKYETEYKADYLNGNLGQSQEEATNSSIYLQDRIQLSEKFALIPGVRYNQSTVDTAVVDKSYDDVSGAIAGEYVFSENLLVKLSTTQLFKAPEVGEVFAGAGLDDVANSEIKAETGHNSEFSFAYDTSFKNSERFSLGFTLFNTIISNYIYDYAPAPESTGARSWKDNIGGMSIEGFEAYIDISFGSLNALVTYANAESELDSFANYAAFDGARIDRQQGDSVSININYDIRKLGLSLHWDVLNVDDVAAGLDLDGATLNNEKSGFTVHNVSASWSPNALPDLSLIAGVDNLTDEYYASQSSRTGTSFHPLFGNLYLLDYEPGRNYKMTLAYQF